MRTDLLVKLYPRAWRDRYGEELSALIEAQGPLSLGQLVDLLGGALAAHFRLLTRDLATRSSKMTIPSALTSRFAVGLSIPLAVLLVGISVVALSGYLRPGPANPDDTALGEVDTFVLMADRWVCVLIRADLVIPDPASRVPVPAGVLPADAPLTVPCDGSARPGYVSGFRVDEEQGAAVRDEVLLRLSTDR